MPSWFRREAKSPTALEVIERELERLHEVENAYTGPPPQYIIDGIAKLHDCLVNHVTEERIAKLITEESK